jgi:hypothetical protein
MSMKAYLEGDKGMKTGPRIWPVACLTAIVVGSIANIASAELSPRSVVAGRQQIRTALTEAMADHKLTQMEEKLLLRKAQRVLSRADLEGFKQTLSRLSAAQKMPASATSARGGGQQPVGRLSAGEAGVAVNEAGLLLPKQQAKGPVDPAQYQEATDQQQQGSPFQDEQGPPEESSVELQPTPDGMGTMGDDFTMTAEDYSEMAAGCGMLAGQFDGLCEGFDASCCYGSPLIRLSTSVEGFKGPLDLDNHNGNFGVQFAVNAGFPLSTQLGLGVQAGTSSILSDFHGAPLTGSGIRSQSFTTVGLYHRVLLGAKHVKYGFAFDWLTDDYYWSFNMSQWRVKLACELDPCNEIGIWSCIPNDGDTARLEADHQEYYYRRFKPLAQGSLYYNRCWCNGASTTAWMGIAEEPGEFVFGGDARMPVGDRLSVIGNFSYVLPSASAPLGQDEEMWNVSLGLEFTLGRGRNHCLMDKSGPLFPLANNGSFAVRGY